MSEAPAARRWFAPAKLNLYLHITGRRADGFHELDGLVAFAGIGDELQVRPAATLSLAIEGPFAHQLDGAVEDNLVWRAAVALARRLGVPGAAAITLRKNLPVASGIGGGSSDAAAALRGLAALWRRQDDAAMAEVARSLGSDVPACLAARPCWIAGVGDRLEPAGPLPACGVLLVNPLVSLPTASVYRRFAGGFAAPSRFAIPADTDAFAARLGERHNDLTAAAVSQVPAIGEVLDRVGRLPAALLTRMSGSGATCFALFRTADDAATAAAELRREARPWWIAATTLGSAAGAAAP